MRLGGELPETEYVATADGLHLAYQVSGQGDRTLLYLGGWVTHLEHEWASPQYARFLRRLGSFSRLVRFDRRGTGLSDRAIGLQPLEQRMDDITTVLDAVSADRAVLLGANEGGSICALFAAAHPNRVSALVLYAAYARRTAAPDYPWGLDDTQVEAMAESLRRDWGKPHGAGRVVAPTAVVDPAFAEWETKLERLALSPTDAVSLWRMTIQFDIRPALSTITAPTLILHRGDDRRVPVEHSRYLAEHIPGAEYVEVPGEDHLQYVGDSDGLLDHVERFVTGQTSSSDPERVLATILFTDLVDSTSRTASMGDDDWVRLLDRHDMLIRRQLRRFDGREIKMTGDGVVALFDGPARAVHCAHAIIKGLRGIGVEATAGLHTGECRLRGSDVGGLTVHVAARVQAAAVPGEVLVSSSVRGLIGPTDIAFVDRGVHRLRGVPGDWRLFGATVSNETGQPAG
ncbi:MAG: adenylate/guanylate cyclase domain-containing protein [Acidimicrobiales bacterium]